MTDRMYAQKIPEQTTEEQLRNKDLTNVDLSKLSFSELVTLSRGLRELLIKKMEAKELPNWDELKKLFDSTLTTNVLMFMKYDGITNKEQIKRADRDYIESLRNNTEKIMGLMAAVTSERLGKEPGWEERAAKLMLSFVPLLVGERKLVDEYTAELFKGLSNEFKMEIAGKVDGYMDENAQQIQIARGDVQKQQMEIIAMAAQLTTNKLLKEKTEEILNKCVKDLEGRESKSKSAVAEIERERNKKKLLAIKEMSTRDVSIALAYAESQNLIS